jgi:hypothetical protein
MVFLALNSFISLSVTLCFASLGFELMFQLSSYPVLREPQVHLVQQFARVDLLYWRFVLNVHMSRTLNASYLAELREHPKRFIQLETWFIAIWKYVCKLSSKEVAYYRSKQGWVRYKHTEHQEHTIKGGTSEMGTYGNIKNIYAHKSARYNEAFQEARDDV